MRFQSRRASRERRPWRCGADTPPMGRTARRPGRMSSSVLSWLSTLGCGDRLYPHTQKSPLHHKICCSLLLSSRALPSNVTETFNPTDLLSPRALRLNKPPPSHSHTLILSHRPSTAFGVGENAPQTSPTAPHPHTDRRPPPLLQANRLNKPTPCRKSPKRYAQSPFA